VPFIVLVAVAVVLILVQAELAETAEVELAQLLVREEQVELQTPVVVAVELVVVESVALEALAWLSSNTLTASR